jgi:hypothetical protein
LSFSALQKLKLDLVSTIGLSKDALHIYAGMIIFLVAVAVVRDGMRSKFPLLAVLLVSLTGEFIDARDNLARLGTMRLGASVHDVLNTMFWPVALWLLARYSRVMK